MYVPSFQLTSDRDRQIYICGPITNITNLNADAFYDMEQKLKDMGYLPVVPHELFDQVDNQSMEHINYMEGCVSAMAVCPSIVVLPGHENSIGCKMEIKIAEAMGKKIIYAEHLVKQHAYQKLAKSKETSEVTIDTSFKGY